MRPDGVTDRIVAGSTLTVDQKWYFSTLMMTDIHGDSQLISVLYLIILIIMPDYKNPV